MKGRILTEKMIEDFSCRELCGAEHKFYAGFPQQFVLFSELDGLQSEVDQATTAGLLPRRKGTDKGGIYATS